MDGIFWLILVLLAIVVVAASIARSQEHKRRVPMFIANADQRGWRYTERDDRLADRYLGAPLRHGVGWKVYHVLAGTHRGREFVAFECVTKHAKDRGVDRALHVYVVAALATPANRPTLEVRVEGLGRKLLGMVGVRDLQLGNEDFDRTFLIRTKDDGFAREVLHPGMVQWMLDDQRCRDLPFRFERADLLTWRESPADVGTVERMLDYLSDVLDQVPGSVWKGLGSAS